MLAKMGKNMRAITIKSIETETHPQTKMMFWFLFASTRGANTRIKIIKLLKSQPYNTHQLSQEISMDYKAVKHHLDVLVKNNIVTKFNATYGAAYYLSPLFEENQEIFDEIATKMQLI